MIQYFAESKYPLPSMMRIQVALLTIFLLVSISVQLNGQPIISANEYPSRPEELIGIFNSSLPGNHSKKIWGLHYSNPFLHITEHQFFKTKNPVQGVLFTKYDTINCTHLLYDLYRDKLIVFEPSIGIQIEIEEEFIRRFKIFEPEGDSIYEFINVEFLDDTAKNKNTAIYQILFEGERLDFYIKHQKILTERIDGDRSLIRFINDESLVLRKGSDYQKIKRNRDLLKMYPGAEYELKLFFRRYSVKLKSASNDQIQLTGKFLDELELQREIPDPSK